MNEMVVMSIRIAIDAVLVLLSSVFTMTIIKHNEMEAWTRSHGDEFLEKVQDFRYARYFNQKSSLKRWLMSLWFVFH